MTDKPDLTIKPDEVEWRVGATFDRNGAKWGRLLGYIDSRLAMEKLDLLDPQWSTRMEPVSLNGDSGIRCTLTVNGVSREDVGVASSQEPLKGAFSDALKRAAVHFGIGRELYDLPDIAAECIVVNGKVRGPKALPEWDGKRWTIDRSVGFVRYDHEPTHTPQTSAARPARESGGPSPAGIPAPAAYDEDPGFAPIDPQTGEPILLQEVAQRTGGTVVPEKPEYVRRAEAKATEASEWVCPVHGTSKVVPAGVSKKTGKPYNAFTACGEIGCNEKPGRRAA